MNTPLDLQQSLSELLGDAQLVVTDLPDTTLKLWLIDAHNMDRAFTPDETRRILYEPPLLGFLLGQRSGVGAVSGRAATLGQR